MKRISLTLCLVLTCSVAPLFLLPGCDDSTTTRFYSTFIPDNTEPPANSVSMQEAEMSGSGRRFKIAVFANDITTGGVYSASFDILFRPVILRYVGYQPGTFFETNGDPVSYQIATQEGDDGVLVVGISLVGDVPEIVDGTAILVILEFEGLAEDLSPVRFANNELRDSTPPAGNKLSGISWYGGNAFVEK